MIRGFVQNDLVPPLFRHWENLYFLQNQYHSNKDNFLVITACGLCSLNGIKSVMVALDYHIDVCRVTRRRGIGLLKRCVRNLKICCSIQCIIHYSLCNILENSYIHPKLDEPSLVTLYQTSLVPEEIMFIWLEIESIYLT